MLEEQLEDFERLTSTHEAKEGRLQEECSKLQASYLQVKNCLCSTINFIYLFSLNHLFIFSLIYQADLEVAQSEVRVAKQALNEEKSFRALAESRVQALENQLEESKGALAQVRDQSSEYKTLAERLTEQANSSEEQASQLEVSLHSAQRQLANLQAEVVGLKEEVATQLTRIHTLKETNHRFVTLT